MKSILAAGVTAGLLALSAAPAGEKQWADGVPFTTDWKTAIKEVQSTGKILLIYNGWERRKV